MRSLHTQYIPYEKTHLKSRNPALDVPRRHEPVATDTVFSDTPAVDSGAKQAQVLPYEKWKAICKHPRGQYKEERSYG